MAHDKEWELRLQLEGKAYGLTLKGDVSLFLEIDTSESKPVLRLIRKDLHEVSLALRVALWWWSDEKIQARLQTELDQLLADIAGAIGHAWATLSLDEPFHWQGEQIEASLSQTILGPKELCLHYTFVGEASIQLGEA